MGTFSTSTGRRRRGSVHPHARGDIGTREIFVAKRGEPPDPRVNAEFTYERAGLQAVDYFPWSLQRLYDHREERYLGLLWRQYRLVRNRDDPRSPTGVYYEQRKRPLTLEALDLGGRPGI